MKLFKNNLHYFICLIVAAVIIASFVTISNVVFVYDTVNSIEMPQLKTNEHPSVYPWCIFDSIDKTVVYPPISEILNYFLIDYASTIKDIGECKYSDTEKTYFFKGMIITDGNTDVKLDMAFRITDAQQAERFEITYMHFHTPQTAAKAELEAALNRYRDMLKNDIFHGNMFTDFYETMVEISERSDTLYTILELYAYMFLMNGDALTSYISDGLVWFAGGNDDKSIVVAIDPSFEDAIILFAMK